MNVYKMLIGIVIFWSIHVLKAQNGGDKNCIQPITSTNLSHLNWKTDNKYTLVIDNNHQCDTNYLMDRSGEISIAIKDKQTDTIVSFFYLQVIHEGETSRMIRDFGIVNMGQETPNMIIIKETYIRDIQDIQEVKLYKLEFKNGQITETPI